MLVLGHDLELQPITNEYLCKKCGVYFSLRQIAGLNAMSFCTPVPPTLLQLGYAVLYLGHEYYAMANTNGFKCTLCGDVAAYHLLQAALAGSSPWSSCTVVAPPLSSTAQHPTAWGLKPVAAGTGCDVCIANAVNPSTPCFVYDLQTRQSINGRGPGFSTWLGPVGLCTACAALQPQSLVAPAPPVPALSTAQAGAILLGLTDDDPRLYGPTFICDCGAKKTYGAADFSRAHAAYCSVAEGKR